MNKILIVDDKANIRLLLKEYLSEQGFNITTANNGRSAIFSIRESPPDLILLDIMMPEMDGFEFLSYYRQQSSTPIIMLTAREEESDTVRALEMGADDYVTKPCRMKELTARIRAQLRRTNKIASQPHLLQAGPIQRVEELYQQKVSEKNVSLLLLPPATTIAPILLDEERLIQLFNNLINNALRFTPAQGTITLSLTQTTTDTLIQIADTGSGIPEADIPHIFDRFYQADASRSNNEGESGLGLAIAKAIVHAHQGTISVTSALNKGTTFTIQLPNNF